MIGLYIINEAKELIVEGGEVLLDEGLDEEEVKKIKQVMVSDDGVDDFHFLKTRESGKYKFVEVHLVVGSKISLMDAHVVADRVEEKIAKLIVSEIGIL